MKKIHPILLAGGSGSRLWPLSQQQYPKQFLNLNGERSLLQDTLHRLAGEDYESPTIIGNNDHRFIIYNQSRETLSEIPEIILEPISRGTAFSISLCALKILRDDPNGKILVLPCDQFLGNSKKFHQAINAARKNSANGLTVFGVEPKSAHTGYGYIEVGKRLNKKMFDVKSFKEKPSSELAKKFLNSNSHFWNTGIFLFSAHKVIAELKLYQPQLIQAAQACLDGATLDLGFLRLPSTPMEPVCENSIDYALLEKSKEIDAVKLECEWNDLGSWNSIWESYPKDKNGNVTNGDVCATQTTNTLLFSNSETRIAANGLDDLIIVVDDNNILVTKKELSEEVGSIAKKLKAHKKAQTEVFRPWGSYKIISSGSGYLIKTLTLSVEGAVSLQYHNHRSEHWILISGKILVECDGKKEILEPNQSTFIPQGSTHRMTNIDSISAKLIEIQTGDILVEEDIVRLEDKYNRS